MASQIDLSDNDIELVIHFDDGGVAHDHPLIRQFDALVREWFLIVSAKEFRFMESPTPGVFRYEFEHVDGREFNQLIDFNLTPIDDPPMNFGTDFWRLSEFAAHRPLRDTVIKLRNKFEVSIINAARP